MTDEELIAILDKYDSRSQTHPNYYSEKEVLSAMREACEKDSEAFIEWAWDNYYQVDIGIWVERYGDDASRKNKHQLYLQFKNQQSATL